MTGKIRYKVGPYVFCGIVWIVYDIDAVHIILHKYANVVYKVIICLGIIHECIFSLFVVKPSAYAYIYWKPELCKQYPSLFLGKKVIRTFTVILKSCFHRQRNNTSAVLFFMGLHTVILEYFNIKE